MLDFQVQINLIREVASKMKKYESCLQKKNIYIIMIWPHSYSINIMIS